MKPLDQLTQSELHQLTTEVYERLSSATTAFINARNELSRAETTLSRKVASAMHEGFIIGKNEKERDGNAQAMFPDLYQEVDAAKEAMWAADLEIQTAKIEEAQLSMGVRIFSLVLGS